MKRFTFELKKHVVVEIDAHDEHTARDKAVNGEDSFDGVWERAEISIVELCEVQELTPRKPKWRNDIATYEGWGIFRADGRYQIQKDDEMGRFDTDAAAIVFVALMASTGSEYHWDALHMIGTLADDALADDA